MKISKIEKVLKQAPNIYLMDEDDTNVQWIGNDYAAFPLWDFQRIEVETE